MLRMYSLSGDYNTHYTVGNNYTRASLETNLFTYDNEKK